MVDNNKKEVVNLGQIVQMLWGKKKVFFIVWIVTFVLSVIWVMPQPRYYKSSVVLAPEAMGDVGGLSSIASTFGLDLGGGSEDAINPQLYPDLLESSEFIVGLFNIGVKSEDEKVDTTYYTYMSKYQKKNWLTQPFVKLKNYIAGLISGNKKKKLPSKDVSKINPFFMSEYDYNLTEKVRNNISCSYDMKTGVITINVQDQDRLICATMADSIKQRIQDFIIRYRTSKISIDVKHYRQVADSMKVEYLKAVNVYSSYCDSHKLATSQDVISTREKLAADLQLKQNAYSAMETQYESMKSKLQEKTPAFTTLKSASVPIKPAGPKRMIFILAMMILTTIVTCTYILRSYLYVPVNMLGKAN